MENPPERLGASVRLGLGLFGTAAFGAGVLAVFVTTNGTGSGVLLAVGSVLLVIALMGTRVESLEFSGAKLKMQAAAAEKYALADELELRGDMTNARRLRTEAKALLEAAEPIAANYRRIREGMQPGPARTQELDRIVADARHAALTQEFEPAKVIRLLEEGDDAARITALGMMQAKRELRNFDAALEAIEHSRSDFEQYHAMLLARKMIDDLTPGEQNRLANAIKAQRQRKFNRASSRWPLSEQILHDLGVPRDHDTG